ncbi:MAG: hypothetical protein RLZZ458_2852, partial [Planctomycetota bacterium]
MGPYVVQLKWIKAEPRKGPCQ